VIRLSVVVPTLDRPRPLAACLAALARSFPADAETLVVSDGGAVDLAPWVAPFVEPLRLRVLATSHGGPARARNHGLAAARGGVVAFIDDDCRPRPGWLTALATGVSCAPPRAAGGTTLNGLASNPYADASQVILDLVARHERAAYGGERFFPSNNVAFPAEALRGLGGFDESYRTAEDRELCRRWRRAGFALERAPDAVVEHDPALDLPGFARQFFAYGRGAARYHAAARDDSFRSSAGFHLRLPALAGSALLRRGIRGGARLAGLLVVWELANLAGFVAEVSARGEARPLAVAATPRRPTP